MDSNTLNSLERLPASDGSVMWEHYGPCKTPMTFDHESFVGPTDINDVAGPLCVVSGDNDEDSLRNASRIARMLNYGTIELVAQIERLEAALKTAEGEVQFWIEHNREMENPMLTAGTRALQTMRVIKSALRNSQNV